MIELAELAVLLIVLIGGAVVMEHVWPAYVARRDARQRNPRTWR